jgi:multidrug efflux pump subunit AcrA (membrane-fusion protein)
MFATVRWVVSRPYQTLFVPASAVNSDLKGTFVIKIQDNTAERIAVERGLTMGDQVEVSGGVHAGDYVALKATDEYKTGTHLNAKIADACDLQNAQKRSSGGGE